MLLGTFKNAGTTQYDQDCVLPGKEIEMIINVIEGLGVLMLLAFGFVYLRAHTEKWLGFGVREVLLGLMFGLVVAVVMLDPIRISGGATFDPRGGPAILAGVFGGPIAALVTAVVGSGVRWYVIGGPVALGGVVGFVLYGLFGIFAGLVITRYKINISPLTILLLGALGTVAVLPSFFVSADFNTALEILKKAGPVLVVNNLLGTLIVGLFLSRAQNWIELQKRLEAKQIENERLALIARETNTGVIITDRSGYAEWTNEAFTKLSGFEAAEIAGKKPGDLLQGVDTHPETVREMSEAIKAGEAFDVEILNYHKRGEPYWVQIHCEPFIDPDGSTKFMAIESDISGRKETEKLKSQFVSLVNHELRTPLTSIIGSIGLVRSGKIGDIPPKAANLIEIAKSNSDRLLAIINDILDFEKLQSGGMEFNFQNVNLNELVNSAIVLNTPYADQFNIKLVRGDTMSEVRVNGDQDRLIQVLTNFLSNASKFSLPEKEVTVTLSVKELRARLEVADIGPGIPPEFHDKVFERFTQAQSGDSRSKGGTGIGLSISKGIIEAHNGEIGFLSNDPTGTIFYFEIPLA